MSADTDLRAVYQTLADRAPSLDTLTIPGTAAAAAAAADSGIARGRGRVLAVAASVLIVIALVTGLFAAVNHRHHAQPTRPPADPTYSWQFGVHSLPGYLPLEREIGPHATTYSYEQIPTDIRRQLPGGRAVLTTFVPDAAAQSAVATLTRTTVHGTAGWSGRVTAATRCTALHLSEMYCPGSVAVWPDTSSHRWVVIQAAPQIGRLVTPLPTLTADKTVALAGTIRMETSARVAAVRVGHVPTAMVLTSVHIEVATDLKAHEKAGMQDLSFAAPTGDATLNLRVSPAKRISLDSASPIDVTNEYGGSAPWSKTEIAGRAAWRSRDGVLMQFGNTVVLIDNESDAGGTGHDSTTPVSELVKTAASLSHVGPVEFDAGSTLQQAIPAAALW